MKSLTFIIFISALFTSEISLGVDQWISKASFAGTARHRSTAFAIGSKGYVGGGHINSGISVYHEDYWQYDPGSDSWTQIADFGGGKRYHSTAFTIGEFAYVGLGEDDDDNYYNDYWRYVPVLNIWQPIAPYPGNPRRGAASFVIDENGYVGTGQSDFGYENDFYRYDPVSNQWFVVADFIGEARSAAVGLSYGSSGYVGTGHVIGDDTRDFYEYDSNTDSWIQKADVGIYDRQDATGFVLNGKGYLGTGNDVDGNVNYKDFWEYDFQNDSWIQVNDFGGEGRRYMVSFVIGNIAYAGTGTDGTNLKDFWSYDPLLGVEEKIKIQTSVYPNPSSDFISILSSEEMKGIGIYNINGQLVNYVQLNSFSWIIEKEDIGSGSFICAIMHQDKHLSKIKIQFN
jgi:N-acetylneuraminic acid mutarotase